MRILGIDYGMKNIGLALSDEEGTIGFPYGVIKSNKKSISKICDICENEKVSQIVVGESLTFSGIPNTIMNDISKFKQELAQATVLPIIFENEIFSTQSAKRIQGNINSIDASSAAIILNSFIERTNYES